MDLFQSLGIRISKIEERSKDSWFDMSLRQLREGLVRFYKVIDMLTGDWLFKTCFDSENHKLMIKALKCPSGKLYAQLEGSSMLFQESLTEGQYYDVVSSSHVDEAGRLHRRIIDSIEEIPKTIRNNYKIVSYEEATGKKIFRNRWVTLCSVKDEKKMVVLFLLERAWPVTTATPEDASKVQSLLKLIRELEKTELDELYKASNEQYGLSSEQTNHILDLLEAKGKIRRTENHIKVSD